MVHYFEFIKQKNKRYVSWNILFLWGFGLWIALCASNVYRTKILAARGKCYICTQFYVVFVLNESFCLATLFSEENWNSGLAYNIVSETEATANLMNVKTANCTLCGTSLPVLRYTCVLLSACLSLVFLCIREQITKSIKILHNVAQNIYTQPVTRDRTNYIFEEKSVTRNSRYILQSKLIIHKKSEKFVLKGYIVQREIMFNYSTFFIFNNYKIYSHFNNQLFRSTWNLITISKIENSKQTKRKLLCLNNNNNSNSRNSSFHIQKNLRKRIISSSPEFQKFLANLRSQILYQCTVEMSTSYVIRIKPI